MMPIHIKKGYFSHFDEFIHHLSVRLLVNPLDPRHFRRANKTAIVFVVANINLFTLMDMGKGQWLV